MSNLDKYDAISERLPDDSTFKQRLEKYGKILAKLNEHGIFLLGNDGGVAAVVADPECGYLLHHGLISWEMFRVDDIVDMIVNMRDNFKIRQNIS